MTYVGRGVDAISNVEKLDNITFNGGTTYNLTKSSAAFTPSGANNILVSMDGIIQSGNFTVAGSTIIFDFSPTSNNTCNFIMHYGTGVLNTPADDTVSAGKLQSNSVTTAKILDANVTTAKITDANVTTAKIADVNVTTGKIADDAITLAKMASGTDGNIISYDASGNPVAIATGTSGHFLKSQGAGNPPVFAAAGGGKIGQVLQTTSTTATATTGGYTAMVPTGTITCAATSSKVLVQWSATVRLHGNSDSSTDKGFNLQLRRTPSGGSNTDYVFGGNTAYKFVYHALDTFGATEQIRVQAHFIYLDSPSSTAELTYTPMLQVHQGSANVCFDSSTAHLILSEVLA